MDFFRGWAALCQWHKLRVKWAIPNPQIFLCCIIAKKTRSFWRTICELFCCQLISFILRVWQNQSIMTKNMWSKNSRSIAIDNGISYSHIVYFVKQVSSRKSCFAPEKVLTYSGISRCAIVRAWPSTLNRYVDSESFVKLHFTRFNHEINTPCSFSFTHLSINEQLDWNILLANSWKISLASPNFGQYHTPPKLVNTPRFLTILDF